MRLNRSSCKQVFKCLSNLVSSDIYNTNID